MANILDKYGIKEVADVTFYEIDEQTGAASVPVLYLDTLKVSTIEQTAEETSAKGGKGNPPLITWDYGKEINVTLEDALFSAKSMAILFGNGTTTEVTSIKKTITWTATTSSNDPAAAGRPSTFAGPQNKNYPIDSSYSPIDYDATGATVSSYSLGATYFLVMDIPIEGAEIEVSPNSFPGTYYITGDTYARSEKTGNDEFFQFIIPKAKVASENTITMEAEGDPSVFNLNLKVLRPATGPMMKLVKYDINIEAEDNG